MRRNKARTGINHRTESIVAVSGTVAGAAVGTIAGPIGTFAGAIVGMVLGAATGAMLEEENEREHQHDGKLDTEIGVYDGPMGVAGPDDPPARVGAFSSSSSGAVTPSQQPSEGPIQDVDE